VDEKEIVAWKVQLVGLRASINDAAIIFKSLILTLTGLSKDRLWSCPRPSKGVAPLLPLPVAVVLPVGEHVALAS